MSRLAIFMLDRIGFHSYSAPVMTFQELRERAGFANRGDLAHRIGVDPGTIRHLDTGHVADPRYSTVEALATVLNTTTAVVMLAIRQSVKEREAA